MAGKPTLKKWIETHPAVVIVGLTFAVGSTVSATTAYLVGQVNQAEATRRQSEFVAEKSDLQTKYQHQVADLTSRLSAIERRVGNSDEKKYFDVKSLQILSSDIKNLPQQFKSFENGSFFVNVPISQEWQYAVTTEGAMLKL